MKDRGRDVCRQAPPPAQIRTRASDSYGSCLESGSEFFTRRRVQDLRLWDVTAEHASEPRPAPAMPLAATPKLTKPKLLDLVEQLVHPLPVAGDGMLVSLVIKTWIFECTNASTLR